MGGLAQGPQRAGAPPVLAPQLALHQNSTNKKSVHSALQSTKSIHNGFVVHDRKIVGSSCQLLPPPWTAADAQRDRQQTCSSVECCRHRDSLPAQFCQLSMTIIAACPCETMHFTRVKGHDWQPHHRFDNVTSSIAPATPTKALLCRKLGGLGSATSTPHEWQ